MSMWIDIAFKVSMIACMICWLMWSRVIMKWQKEQDKTCLDTLEILRVHDELIRRMRKNESPDNKAN